ncbi:PhzF family phenazine biosynthesis protein [Agromyces sp. NPDC058484]|uniref:PhzF family phenazine biosynthesis protein n=1 Tax=Agromyces sp. NPDC058484 TaxID=3346524 RepID=UPI0036524B40
MSDTTQILRYAAFTADAAGGNPAGVVLDAAALSGEQMQGIAADVDYSETAFITGFEGDSHHIRYFSPLAEVPFCGHATIATAVALAERDGPGLIRFATAVGEIQIQTRIDADGQVRAAFTSVEPAVADFPPGVLDSLLGLLGLTSAELDDRYPARVAFAGNWHPIIVVADARSFDAFTFDPGAVRRMMDDNGWSGTVTVLHALGEREFEARNLFPVGRITEDPATGSAAASLGGYLRELGLVTPPARVIVRQGRHVGRPSALTIDIPFTGGMTVSGTAVPIRV